MSRISTSTSSAIYTISIDSERTSTHRSRRPQSWGTGYGKKVTKVRDSNNRAPHTVKNFFPHLPPYVAPTEGLIAKLPSSWVPYAQLMRLDRPAGFYAYYIPYLTGLVYAACIAERTPSPETLVRLAVLLVPFNVLMRGVACTWNDTVDQGFDRQVERCRHRPVARGAVSTTQANLFTLAQLAVAYPFLTSFFPVECYSHTAITLICFLIYSLLKRVSYYPQVFLGLPNAWPVFFSTAALGMNPFGVALKPTLAMFAAHICWTIIFDTIYAHQDIRDDEKAGVKGMSLRFRSTTKQLASIMGLAQVSLLVLCGYWADLGPLYMIGTAGGVAAALAAYIYCVDLGRPESCGNWFYRQFFLVGAGFLAGLLAEYWLKLSL